MFWSQQKCVCLCAPPSPLPTQVAEEPTPKQLPLAVPRVHSVEVKGPKGQVKGHLCSSVQLTRTEKILRSDAYKEQVSMCEECTIEAKARDLLPQLLAGTMECGGSIFVLSVNIQLFLVWGWGWNCGDVGYCATPCCLSFAFMWWASQSPVNFMSTRDLVDDGCVLATLALPQPAPNFP